MVQLKNKTYKQHESDGIISYDTKVRITRDEVIINGKPSAETWCTVTTSEFHIATKDFVNILKQISKGDIVDDKKIKPGPGSDVKWKAIFVSYEPGDYHRIHLYQCVSGKRWAEYGDPNELWSIEAEILNKIMKDNPEL